TVARYFPWREVGCSRKVLARLCSQWRLGGARVCVIPMIRSTAAQNGHPVAVHHVYLDQPIIDHHTVHSSHRVKCLRWLSPNKQAMSWRVVRQISKRTLLRYLDVVGH